MSLNGSGGSTTGTDIKATIPETLVYMGVFFICGYTNPIVFGSDYTNISTEMCVLNGLGAVLSADRWFLLKIASLGTQNLFKQNVCS